MKPAKFISARQAAEVIGVSGECVRYGTFDDALKPRVIVHASGRRCRYYAADRVERLATARRAWLAALEDMRAR